VTYWCNFETVDLESKISNITISVRLSYSFMEISYSSDLCMSTKHYSLLHSLMCLVFNQLSFIFLCSQYICLSFPHKSHHLLVFVCFIPLIQLYSVSIFVC